VWSVIGVVSISQQAQINNIAKKMRARSGFLIAATKPKIAMLCDIQGILDAGNKFLWHQI